MSIDWSRFKGQYVRWDSPGTVIAGVVSHIGIGSYQQKEYPELTVRTDDGDQIVSANQSGLQRALADDPPVVGDGIRIEYLGEASTAAPGFHPAKKFTVVVTHRTAAAPPAAQDLV